MKFFRLTLFIAVLVVSAKAAVQDHYPMYGVFFYNFTKYIQWPEDYSQGDFEVMVLGETPMVAELKKLAERKKVNGRSFKIIEITSVSEIKKCQAIFLSASSSQLLPEVVKKIKGLSVLLVTEKEGSTKKGAAINYVEKDGKPAFEINLEAANEHKLKVFSELAKWAVVI